MNTYTLHFTDDSQKLPLTIPPRHVDVASTTLALTGQGVMSVGEHHQQNMLHVLENFCSPTAPLYPTVGQLWFNPSTHVMSRCDHFQLEPMTAVINSADPYDPSYARDINNQRIPVWVDVSINPAVQATLDSYKTYINSLLALIPLPLIP